MFSLDKCFAAKKGQDQISRRRQHPNVYLLSFRKQTNGIRGGQVSIVHDAKRTKLQRSWWKSNLKRNTSLVYKNSSGTAIKTTISSSWAAGLFHALIRFSAFSTGKTRRTVLVFATELLFIWRRKAGPWKNPILFDTKSVGVQKTLSMEFHVSTTRVWHFCQRIQAGKVSFESIFEVWVFFCVLQQLWHTVRSQEGTEIIFAFGALRKWSVLLRYEACPRIFLLFVITVFHTDQKLLWSLILFLLHGQDLGSCNQKEFKISWVVSFYLWLKIENWKF